MSSIHTSVDAIESIRQPNSSSLHTNHRELVTDHIYDLLDRVRDAITPVWPLKDYVAVNPYGGFKQRRFLNTRQFMRIFSDCEMLMPVDYYADQLRHGKFGLAEIEAAVAELQAESYFTGHLLTVDEIVERIESHPLPDRFPSDAVAGPRNTERRIWTLSELIDRHTQSEWTTIIHEEISKFCAAHYDDGQASWPNPWKGLPLFQAWRSAAEHDRNIEVLGLNGFRRFVRSLPHTPHATIAMAMHQLGVPPKLWETLLLCHAYALPGWMAWARYQTEMSGREGIESEDVIGLLAIRLAYDAALSRRFDFHVKWDFVESDYSPHVHAQAHAAHDDTILRYTLLRASEIRYQSQLVETLSSRTESRLLSPAEETASIYATTQPEPRKLAQAVFCIDVRSERIRRHLESTSTAIETFGFAGFFGLPIEFVPLGATCGSHQVPLLLSPQFKLYEGFSESDMEVAKQAVRSRSWIRSLRKTWKSFQTSAVGCFTFVETAGLFYAWTLLKRMWGCEASSDSRFDGVTSDDRSRLGPTLQGLDRQGLTTGKQAELAESVLRNLGLTDRFARIVLFCGHGSQTENNPLQAGLDCGACGGHSGESNARFAAKLLNQTCIRHALAERGIRIPEDTWFIAGLHNTTSDTINIFNADDLPQTHHADLRQLVQFASIATDSTRRERMPIVGSRNVEELLQRTSDWSEVRPEWGLAGNAAFIVGPRELTKGRNLEGRAFLHNYDADQDPDLAVLEQIMTAPMIVAHLINMQYYASTVDNHHFGSGTKTVHNVVGRFGIYSGNGGDLRTGLPWESLHDGRDYQHYPLRLLVVISAARASIEAVIAKHEMVETLLTNGWIHLIAVEDDQYFRYAEDQSWLSVKVTA